MFGPQLAALQRSVAVSPRIATALVAALLVAACATSPLGRRQIMLVSDKQMSEMGVSAYREMQKKTPATKDAKVAAYVNCVSGAVVKEVGGGQAWEVTVFDDKQVNAFALPGGKIGVYTGLLKVADTPDQLAAVIGHEVAHVLARHGAERVSEQMVTQLGLEVASATTGVNPQMLGIATDVFFLLPHSRGQESEADLLGLDLMAKAGFDPRQAVTLWQNMSKDGGKKPPEMLSTHPSDRTRIDGIAKRLPKALPLYEQAQAAGRKPQCVSAGG
ncbi:MAG: M48 family metallopeptidase [Gammaproteobacteria bacterium]|nr:M48 family metallopeptidase [Gammaproteobacteria bacterium]